MPRYSEYPGQYFCHTCKSIADVARFYYSSFDLTWMCSNRHLSKVNLDARGY